MRALLSIVAIAALAAAAPGRPVTACDTLKTACSDLYRSIECGTLENCIPYWERLKTPVGNDTELCATCKEMVQEARENLLSNLTQSELQEVLEGSCDVLIPIPPFNGICKKLMDTFQDELNDMLVSRMDPTQVCTVSGLCWKPDNSDIEQRASEIFLRQSAKKTCNTCKASVTNMAAITKFAGKRDFIEGFSNACQGAGYSKAKCDEFAQTYFAKFLHHFQLAPSERTCQFLGRCDGPSRPMSVGPADTMECEFCEAMIHKVVVQFNNTSMKQQVKTVLENICKTTGSWAAECQQRIEDDFDKAYDELISMLNPVKACTLAGICNSKQSLRSLPMAKLTPARPATALGSAAMCTICQDVAKVVQKAVNANFTQNQLIGALDLVCDVLPTASKENCFDFVNKNVPQLIQMFNERFTVDHICSESFKFCPAATEEETISGEVTCVACRVAVDFLRLYVNKSDSDEEIAEAFVADLCGLLPFEHRKCMNFVEDNFPRLREFVEEELDSGVICETLLRVCLAGKRDESFSDYLIIGQFSEEPSENCSVCLTAMSWVFHFANGRRHRVVIKFGLDEVCNKYPNILVPCKRFKDTYSARILDLVEKGNLTTAQEVCRRLELCPETLKLLAFTELRAEFREDKCHMCETAVSWVASELNSTRTEDDIIKLVQEVCDTDLIPPKSKSSCRSEIEAYGSLIIHLLVHRMDPGQICSEIRLCNAPRAVKPAAQVPDPVCDECQLIANHIVAALDDDRTERNIKNVLDKTCQMIPVDYGRCEQFINTNLDQLFEILRQKVTADEICKTLRLCASRVAVADAECVLCSQVVDYLIHKLKGNFSDAAALEAMEKVCKVLPVDQKQCQNYIDVYGGYILSMLERGFAADAVCAAIGLCDKPKPVDRAPEGVTCEECQKIAGYIVEAINDDRSEANIKAVLERTCEACPDVDGCRKFIDENVDTLFELLRQEVTVDRICKTVGLCGARNLPRPAVMKSGSTGCELCSDVVGYLIGELKDNTTDAAILDALQRVCEILPVDRAECQNVINVYDEYIISMIQQDATPNAICAAIGRCKLLKPIARAPADICEECQKIAGYIVMAINDDRSEANIKAVLDKTCESCPDMDGCRKFMDEHVDALFELLRQEVTVDRICKTLGLCAAPEPAARAPRHTCEECQKFAGYIVAAINDDHSEANIKAVLENTCEACPDKDGCRKFMDEHVDALFELLRQEVTVDGICKALKLCGAPKPAARAPGHTCEECQKVAGYIVAAINDDRSEANIKAVLENTCEACPDKDGCRKFMDEHVDALFELLRQEVTVDGICKALKLCGAPKPAARAPGHTCEECQKVAGYIVAAINDDRSEANIKAVLENTCEACPDKDGCRKFMDEHVDALFELLRQEVTVDGICKALKLCGAQKPVVRAPGVVCEECQKIAGYIVAAVNDDRSQENIKAVLEKTCELCPDIDGCQQFIDTNLDQLFELLRTEVTVDHICKSLRLCGVRISTASATKSGTDRAPASDSCQLCQSIAGFVITELKDNKTQSAIVAALERGCAVLPVDQTQCKNIIDTYSSMIVSMIQNDLTPDEICGTLKFCSAPRPKGQSCELCETVAHFLVDELKDNKTAAAILDALERVCNVLPVDKVSCRNTIDTYGSIIMSLIQQDASADEICAAIGLCSTGKIARISGADSCNACKAITGFLIDELKDNQTDAAVIAALEKVCKVVPIDKTQCQNYIDVYGNMVIELIKNNLSADEICSTIGFCSTGEIQSSDSQVCPLCEIVVHLVEAELENRNTQSEIEAALDKACSLMPESEQQECRNMVIVYTASIIDMLESLVSAEQICQTFRFCPTPPTPPKCEVCLYITNFVESELSDNRTEAQILKLLDKACDVIPSVDVPQCKETINQFSDMIITLLLQSIPPRKICEEIKMCQVSKKPSAFSRAQARIADGEQCALCKWLVIWVDDKLQDNRTEAIIIDEIGKACDLLSDAKRCKDMVNDYVDMIVKMLVQYADPEKICEAVRKCPAKQLKKDDPPCRYCRYVVDELRSDVQKTEADLKKELDGICRVLPVDPSSCQTFVEQYADQIINLILSDADPEKICEMLGVCLRRIKATTTKCNFCEEVMRFVTNEVQDETNDDEIVALVARACDFVPAIHREDCRRMVEIEGLLIARLIGQSLDADSICEAVNYCPEKRNSYKLACTWCQYALHFIQEKLYDNSTQEAIKQELEKMCSDLPKPDISAECKEFVDTYGTSLEVIIAQDLDPSVICPAIHACPAPRVPIKHARRTSSQKCHDCVSTLRSFRHNPAQICTGVSPQFADRCVGASSTGLQIVNVFGNDFGICKLAKSCFKLSGSFTCNRGGCQHAL